MNKSVSKSPILTFKNIMCCIFNIKPLDVAVYLTLLRNGPSKVNTIAEMLNRDRSTIQRSMQNLIKADLVKRKQVNLRKGGYFYRYEAVPFNDVKSKILKTIEGWCNEVKMWVGDIDNRELEKYVERYVKNR